MAALVCGVGTGGTITGTVKFNSVRKILRKLQKVQYYWETGKRISSFSFLHGM